MIQETNIPDIHPKHTVYHLLHAPIVLCQKVGLHFYVMLVNIPHKVYAMPYGFQHFIISSPDGEERHLTFYVSRFDLVPPKNITKPHNDCHL